MGRIKRLLYVELIGRLVHAPAFMADWVDVHGHFYPPASDAEREKKWQAMIDGKFLVPKEATLWDPESTIAYLDKAGIQMQMLSNIPKTLAELKSSNDYASSVVRSHPTRFGFLAALPTDDPDAAVEEIDRATSKLGADGFAVTCHYNNVYLGDASLDKVWEELNRRSATVFTHPNAYAPANLGRPSPLIEVAFETARTVVDMVYAKTFLRFPNIRWIISHCGGSLPALSGRLKLLGVESWVPNPHKLTVDDISNQLATLFVDTAATGTIESVGPAVAMTGKQHLVYGSDCGVPCSTEQTLEQNRLALKNVSILTGAEVEALGRRAFELFPSAKKRLSRPP